MKLDGLFAPGNRKNMAFIIGILLSMFGEKLGVEMTDDVQQSIITLIAIFTGGNVLSKFAYVLGQKKVVEELDVKFPPTPAAEKEESEFVVSELARIDGYAAQIAKDATAELNKVHQRCKAIETHVAKQSQSINDLIAMIQRPQAAPQGRTPTPNELYQG